ncbi:ester cyclase [Leisingera sp. ANG-M1]|uniref:ester cyclase n=1 Tax=Leisingera sp. ANG-M1 TaxID=1577895 RepID=UPI00068EBD04|nr:ester cyclase [Leisingera sp. ANG-M1]
MTDQERNKATVADIYATCWNKNDMQRVDEIFDEDVRHGLLLDGWPSGRDGFKKLVAFWREAFPDIHEDAIDLVADGNTVMSRFRLRGTHQGDFYGIPGTGRKVDIYGAEWFKFDENGKVTDYLYHEDTLGLFFQLGVMPLPHLAIAGVDGSQK